MKNNLPVTQVNRPVQHGVRLITATTTDGVILYANDDFVEISGFTREELLNQNHNIIRHPDVPPAVFGHMWGYLKAGRSWMGIVKNRCKNGDHYWVSAYITPVTTEGQITGYESVRTTASPEHIERATKLYQALHKRNKVSSSSAISRVAAGATGVLSGGLAIAPVLALGMPGIVPGLVLAACVGLLMQRRRDARINRELSAHGDNQINDPMLALMYTDERGIYAQLQMGLLSQRARIQTLLSRVADFSSVLERQASDGAQMAGHTSQQIERQMAETDQVATAVTEMAASSHEVANNVSLVASASQEAITEAKRGQDVARSARTTIDTLAASLNAAAEVQQRLSEGTKKIGTILDVITGVADQTNLLALNAAIEAARAGEHGRGFAVVADEVRLLASSSARSTEQIHELITGLQEASRQAVEAMEVGRQQAGQGVDYVAQVDRSLTAITQAVSRVGEMSEQIAAATEEQSAVAEEVSQSINHIAGLSADVAGEATNHAILSADLAATAMGQSDLVDRFNLTHRSTND